MLKMESSRYSPLEPLLPSFPSIISYRDAIDQRQDAFTSEMKLKIGVGILVKMEQTMSDTAIYDQASMN